LISNTTTYKQYELNFNYVRTSVIQTCNQPAGFGSIIKSLICSGVPIREDLVQIHTKAPNLAQRLPIR